MAAATIEQLRACGARVVSSMGTSDIALHRCLLAQQVVDVLHDDHELKHVLWFDDDMVGSSAHVRMMIRISDALRVSVTGAYCKHTSQRLLTARRYPGEVSTLVYSLTSPERPSVELFIELLPVLAGMGCMLVPADQFLGVWDASPVFSTHSNISRPLRAICASGPVHDSSGDLGWVSEDQVYSQALWQYARGVYFVPIPWGHLTEVSLYPLSHAIFLSGDETDDEYAGLRMSK